MTYEDSETRNKKCEERIEEQLKGRIEDLRILFYEYNGNDEYHEELGTFNEYGLAFDYVPSDETYNTGRSYFRYQLSWGGPSDEFRFYVDFRDNFLVEKIEYWFLDWFDGASIKLKNEDFKLLEEIFEDFKDMEIVKSEFEKNLDY